MTNMKRHIIYIISLISALSLSVGQSRAQEVLSLDSCVQMALRNNREIQAAAKQAEQYRHTQKSYFANFFPKFTGHVLDLKSSSGEKEFKVDLNKFIPAEISTAFGQILPGIGQMLDITLPPDFMAMMAGFDPTIGIGYKVGNVFHAGISLQQPIYMGGKISAAYRMSKLGSQMAQVNEALTADQVIVATHEAYALLLQASQMHQVAVQYDSLLSQLMTDVKNAERHGLRGHNDVLKVQVKKTEAELQIRQAENGIRLAQMNLCHYIGLPLTAEPKVELLTADVKPASKDASITARPEYSLLELKSELSAQQVKLTRSDFLPQLGLMAQYGYTNGIEIMDQKLFNSPSAAVLVNLTVPLYHANEGYHKVKAAKLEHERTMLEQEDLIEKMNLELQQAANVLDESILELELTRRNMESAEENLRASKKSFDLGLESLSDYLESQTLWQQACAKQAIAQAQVIVNTVKYRKASGTL